MNFRNSELIEAKEEKENQNIILTPSLRIFELWSIIFEHLQ